MLLGWEDGLGPLPRFRPRLGKDVLPSPGVARGRADYDDLAASGVMLIGLPRRDGNVAPVDVVQLDCEGYGCSIIKGIVTHCTRNPDAWPRLIYFEANHLTRLEVIEETLGTLVQHGYVVRYRNSRNCAVVR